MVLIGVTSVVEPVCPAVDEAAAIVEAEWMRLTRPSEPARHPTGELPAPRRSTRRTRTLARTAPTRSECPPHARVRRARWPVSPVWARERSPPVRAG